MAEGIPPKMVWGRKLSLDEEEQEPEQPIVRFAEIMEEQEHQDELEQTVDSIELSIANNISMNEDFDCSRDYLLALELSHDPDCSADELLAMKLQREFDREHELEQKFEESRAKSGKATAVLTSEPYSSRYVREKEAELSSDEEEDLEDEEELREFATNLLYEKHDQDFDFPPSGIVQKEDGAYVTKHDRELDERKNADKAMQLPLNLPTGDVLDHRISRRVYNELRTFGKLETKRQMRVKDKEEKATSEVSVDVQTRLVLLKWINSGQLDRVEGIIATGKESAVLHALSDGNDSSQEQGTSQPKKSGEGKMEMEAAIEEGSDDGSEEDAKTELNLNRKIPSLTNEQTHYAVKVYKTTLAGFKNRAEYVKNDFRFKNPRRVMKVWAEKEFLNLQRLRRANIKCPIPIKLKKHILLMSMIGDTVPAPKLRFLEWTSDQMKQDAFAQVRQIVSRMYKECKLVHGDLSEFNLLYHSDQVYVIDMAQAMDLSHPASLRFLHRDIVNVLDFFGRIGCDPLPTTHTIFKEVTEIEFDPEKDLYVQIETFERENRNMDIRDGKKHSANYELRTYQRESTGREDSPSRPYN